jgi:hypothetical protein
VMSSVIPSMNVSIGMSTSTSRLRHSAERLVAELVGVSTSALRTRGGRSGYPISSGRVIRVLRNSGNENHYPISAPEKHYP